MLWYAGHEVKAALRLAGLEAALEALEGELGITVALHYGGDGQQWTREMALRHFAARHLEINEDSEDVIPLVFWATLSPSETFENIPIPDELYQDDEAPARAPEQIADVPVPGEPAAAVTWSPLGDEERFAEVGDRIVAIPLSLLRHMNRTAMKKYDPAVFVNLIREAIDEEKIEAARAEAQERSRVEVLALMQERDEGELTRMRNQIDDNDRNIAQYEQSIDQWRADNARKQAIVDAAIARQGETISEEAANREWDALLRHAHVERVELRDKVLRVYTDDLEIEHPTRDETAPLGRFRLEFYFERENVMVYNLTNRRGNRDHPHVLHHDFCLGEIGRTIRELLRERQIGAVANFILDSLTTSNPSDDYGRYVEWWFNERETELTTGDTRW